MDIELNIVTLKNFKSVKDDKAMSFNADLNLKFYVNEASGTKDLAVEIILKDFYFNFNAAINNMTLNPQLVSSVLNQIEIVQSTVGNFDTTEIIALYQQLFGYAIGPLNTYLSTTTLVVPDMIFGLFGLSNL